MPSIAELGARVKSKFPGAYDDIDDEALGLKIQAKHPGSYDDFSPAASARPAIPPGLAPDAPPSFLSNLAHSVINFTSPGPSAGPDLIDEIHRTHQNPLNPIHAIGSSLSSLAGTFLHPIDSFHADPIQTLNTLGAPVQALTHPLTRLAGRGAMEGIRAEAPAIHQAGKIGRYVGAGLGGVFGGGGIESVLGGGEGYGAGYLGAAGARAIPAAVRGARGALSRRAATQFTPAPEYYVPPIRPEAPPEPSPAAGPAPGAPAFPVELDPEYLQQLQRSHTRPPAREIPPILTPPPIPPATSYRGTPLMPNTEYYVPPVGPGASLPPSPAPIPNGPPVLPDWMIQHLQEPVAPPAPPAAAPPHPLQAQIDALGAEPPAIAPLVPPAPTPPESLFDPDYLAEFRAAHAAGPAIEPVTGAPLTPMGAGEFASIPPPAAKIRKSSPRVKKTPAISPVLPGSKGPIGDPANPLATEVQLPVSLESRPRSPLGSPLSISKNPPPLSVLGSASDLAPLDVSKPTAVPHFNQFSQTGGPYKIMRGRAEMGSYDTLADAQKSINDSSFINGMLKVQHVTSPTIPGIVPQKVIDISNSPALPAPAIPPVEGAPATPERITPYNLDPVGFDPASPQGKPTAEHYKTAARTTWGKNLAAKIRAEKIDPASVKSWTPAQWDAHATELRLGKSSPDKIARAIEFLFGGK